MGDLIPTALGEQLLPIVTGVSRVVVEASRAERAQRREAGEPRQFEKAAYERTSAYADFMEAATHAESLELQLRGPDGRVIPTERIAVQDTEFLLSLARDAEQEADAGIHEWDPELEAMMEHDCALDDEWLEGEEPEGLWDDYGDPVPEEKGTFPRYQIQVRLLDASAIP